MASLKTLVAAFSVVAFAATAQAADMPGNWPPPYQPKPPQNFSQMISGWYIRGDIGYRWNSVGSAIGSSSAAPITSSTIDNVFTGGAGVGWKHQWFRADLTVDYGAPAKFNGAAAGVPTYYQMKIDAVTALANVYIDIGTWYGFTPYVGAGLGGSYVRTADYVVQTLGPSAVISTRNKFNFSWAAMGGVSYQILPNIALDVGYRYLSIGHADSGYEPPAGIAYTAVKNISSQDVRVGVRFLLD